MRVIGSDLGLPGLIITGERETWSRVYIEAEPRCPVCPHCGSADGLSDPAPSKPLRIHDTPSRGRPTEILLTPQRYHCSPCNRRFVARGEGIQSERLMTDRLVDYILNEAPRRPRKAIAAAVGFDSPDSVDRLVVKFAERLARHHRFPTPRILGVDDIKMNKKIYHLFTDAETGKAVGFVDGSDTEALDGWVGEHLVVSDVRVLVTDLGGALRSLGQSQRFQHVVHVADRWHLLQGAQKAMARVIAQELAKLYLAANEAKARGVRKKLNEPRRTARTLRDLRRDLLGRRRGKRPIEEQSLFDGRLLEPILKDEKLARVGKAFWARIELAKVHGCETEAAAKAQLEQFYRAASEAGIATEFRKIVKRIRTHERLVLNYFVAAQRLPDADRASLTTSSTERRNGTFRASWKAGRGSRVYSYLRFLALYEPWHFGRDIVVCGEPGCNAIEGPTGMVPGLVGQDPAGPALPAGSFRCVAHTPSADVRAV